jgi:plasmid stability protein
MSEGCMSESSLTIDDIPDEVERALAAQAEAHNLSIEDYLRMKLIEIAQRPDPSVSGSQAGNDHE